MVSQISDSAEENDVSYRESINSNTSNDGSIPRNLKKTTKFNLLRLSSSFLKRNGSRNSDSGTENEKEIDDAAFALPDSNDSCCSSVSTDSSIISRSRVKQKRRWHTIVTIVLVEAKGLPELPQDGAAHTVFCKFRLGSETAKSNSVPNTRHPEWRERLKMRLFDDQILMITLWDKGKQKNIMGSSFIDLSGLEKERTHEIWSQLEDGFGMLHLAITLCQIRKTSPVTVTTSMKIDEVQEKFAWHNLKSDWDIVGQLHVRVISARGLTGKPNAYCTLELDNESVLTPTVRSSPEAIWDQSYMFNVRDVTSTLDLRLYDTSLVNSIRNDALGKISIPLLRIKNGVKRWYALKDRKRRQSAKGNASRILLEMTMIWNPVKATAKLFQPKEVKYIKKSPKFDVILIYSNLQFMRDTFNDLQRLNESFKSLFEWQDRELSFLGVVLWCLFWYYFKVWAAPLLLVIPFFYFWVKHRSSNSNSKNERYRKDEHYSEKPDKAENLINNTVTRNIKEIPELTITITRSVEYCVSTAERLINLVSFKVPFLSYLTIILLLALSVVLLIIPFNYILIALGLYKYLRKCINPNRILNNDLLDFLSRIPDNELLKEWKELNVPEPNEYSN